LAQNKYCHLSFYVFILSAAMDNDLSSSENEIYWLNPDFAERSQEMYKPMLLMGPSTRIIKKVLKALRIFFSTRP